MRKDFSIEAIYHNGQLCHSRESGNPEAGGRKTMDSRFRGNNGMGSSHFRRGIVCAKLEAIHQPANSGGE
ncbi:MAG: hypothetical protein K8F56_08545, partial [Rhodocyclaceae bacterium]|nr:hypothetical protein [Rhodocyclaceae bacterium]